MGTVQLNRGAKTVPKTIKKNGNRVRTGERNYRLVSNPIFSLNNFDMESSVV